MAGDRPIPLYLLDPALGPSNYVRAIDQDARDAAAANKTFYPTCPDDGVTDSLTGFVSDLTRVATMGGGVLSLNPKGIYRFTSLRPGQPGYGINGLFRPGVSIEGNGATIISTFGARLLGIDETTTFTSGTTASITSDLAAFTNQFAVSTVAGFSVGDLVAVRIGDNAYDANEPRWTAKARVTAIDATNSILTLDARTQIAFTFSSITNANNKLIRKFDADPSRFFIRNLNLEYDNRQGSTPNPEGGIYMMWCSDFLVESVTGNKLGIGTDMGAGLVFGQFCERGVIRRCTSFKNLNTGAQSSKGRFTDWSNSEDIDIDDCVAIDHVKNFVVAESYSRRIRVRNPTYRSRVVFPSAPTLFAAVQEASLEVVKPAVDITGNASTKYIVSGNGGTNGRVVVEGGLSMAGDLPIQTPIPPDIKGRLRYSNPTDAIEFDCDALTTELLKIPLTSSMSGVSYRLPTIGRIFEAQVFASALLTDMTQVSGLYVGTTRDNGNNVAASLVAGSWITLTPTQMTIGAGLIGSNSGFNGASVANATSRVQFLVNTGASVPAGAFLLIKCRVAKVISTTGPGETVGAALAMTDAQAQVIARS